MQNFLYSLYLMSVITYNKQLKYRITFMEDIVEGINERSSDASIWFLTIGICLLGASIVALVCFLAMT